jgi:hypothetical protein
MIHRQLHLGLLLSIAFVLAVVYVFAYAPKPLLGVDRPTSAADLGQLLSAAQSIFAGLAFIGVVYTILRQHLDLQEQREKTEISLELATAAALFAYYNDKIASLRRAIARDAAGRQDLRQLLSTGTLDDNVADLRLLLAKHAALRKRMEDLNQNLAPPDLTSGRLPV